MHGGPFGDPRSTGIGTDQLAVILRTPAYLPIGSPADDADRLRTCSPTDDQRSAAIAATRVLVTAGGAQGLVGDPTAICGVDQERSAIIVGHDW